MPYEIIHYPNDEDAVYISIHAAYIACVSLDFLLACQQEGLIARRQTTQGQTGYTLRDIQKLQIIRRLHEDLDLSFPAIEVVLHMREQIEDLVEQRISIERKLLIQEAELRQLKKLLQGIRSAV